MGVDNTLSADRPAASAISLGIGELARLSKRTVHTIRWYEAQGLMPNVERDAGGRRRYTRWHVDWLLFLERLKTTAMPIRDMKRYADLVGRGAHDEEEKLLLAHRENVSTQLQSMTAALALIDRKLARYAKRRQRS